MRRPFGETLWPFLILAGGHLAGCLYYFPPREIFSGEPLLTSDYVLHFLEAARAKSHLREGSFLGYSTTWLAGFPDGFAGMIKNKPFVLAVAAVPERWQPLAFNLAVLLALWTFPPLVYAAARELGHDRRRAATSMGLAMTAWYGSGLFRIFWRGGSVIFIVGSGIALWTTARLAALWTGSEPRSPWTVALGATAILWVHPAAALIVLLGGAIVYVETFAIRRFRAGDLLAISLTAALLNVPWLLSYVPNRELIGSLYYPIYQGGLSQALFDWVRGPLGLWQGPRVETAVLGPLFLAAIGAALIVHERRDRKRLFGLLALALALVAYPGHRIHAIATLQPYRYAIPLAGLLSIAAAPLFVPAVDTRRPRFATMIALLVALMLANRVRSSVVHSSDYFGAGLGKRETWALAALRVAAAPAGRVVDGRVLLEGDWLSEPVESRPTARRVSYSFVGFERYLQGEFIGAEATGIGLREGFASFWQGLLFGRRIADYDVQRFGHVCDLYDIRWVLSAREETKRRLESFAPKVQLLAENGPIALFRVDGRSSVVASGDSDASSDGHSIRFDTSTLDASVLKYHWIPGLTSDPPAEITPVALDPDSPTPFIEIRPPRAGRYVISWRPRG